MGSRMKVASVINSLKCFWYMRDYDGDDEDKWNMNLIYAVVELKEKGGIVFRQTIIYIVSFIRILQFNAREEIQYILILTCFGSRSEMGFSRKKIATNGNSRGSW